MAGNTAFQGHRRAPSEVSDVSSIHSPYLSQHESFDGVENSNPSPLLTPQNDPGLYDNTLGIESFTLSGQQQQQQHPQQQQLQGFSPAHSPYLSPQLMPQQGPEVVPNIPYISAPSNAGNNNAQYPNPPDMFGSGIDAMGMDIGQASQMAPPSINVELAPPSRNPTMGGGLGKTTDIDSLSPPPRRIRSVSDPYTRPVSRPRSPSASSGLAPSTPARSLSPFDTIKQAHSNPGSREPSPSRASNRRSSTSSIDNRNYILDLADPQRPGASPNDSKRVQKHPATFQ
ncbi:DNA-binding transcription factor, partial [Elasticomyces elasticus]